MNLLFKLSGEHPELPRAEVFAILEGEGILYRILSEEREKRILILEVETENPLFINRLAMTKKVGEFIGASKDMEELVQKLDDRMTAKTFTVESESQSVRETLGEEIWKLGYGVDLMNPDSRILCFEDEKEGYKIAIETPIERNFNKRKPHKRPYFHPTSTDPKIARVLVNLARIKKGDMVFDPFCGAGGILIEAGLMGMQLRGCDISAEMLEGCMRNLEHFNLDGRIIECDALKIKNVGERIDAIVTDLPYGRSSFMTDRNKERFYSDFLRTAENILEKGKHLVVVFPDSVDIDIGSTGFDLREEYSLYVHKSLTRKILVLRRS
jgi:tRNA (guanine10-N2)-dimethyltransferase